MLSCTAANPSVCTWAAGGGSSTPSYPVTVAGTTTSGGIPYFNSTTQSSSSGILNSNILVKGGGAGGAPKNSSVTDDATTVTIPEKTVITSQAIGNVPLTINGYSSGQTADLFDAYDYTGNTKVAYIDKGGNIFAPSLQVSIDIQGEYINGGSFAGSGNTASTTQFQTAGGANYITGSQAAYTFNTASNQSAAANTPSGMLLNGITQFAGTATGTWTGMTLAQTYGAGSTNIYNGSLPIRLTAYVPTINISTSSTQGYTEIYSEPVETLVSSTATNYFIQHYASGGSTANFSVTEAGGLTAATINVAAARKGTFVCTAGGTIAIANVNEIATSDVIISLNAHGGTITKSPAMVSVTAGTGFSVLCDTLDTSTYNYRIEN